MQKQQLFLKGFLVSILPCARIAQLTIVPHPTRTVREPLSARVTRSSCACVGGCALLEPIKVINSDLGDFPLPELVEEEKLLSSLLLIDHTLLIWNT
jgi:hypothetical protein